MTARWEQRPGQVGAGLPDHRPSELRRRFNRRVDRVAAWLVKESHPTAALRLWRACGLMSGHRPARRNEP